MEASWAESTGIRLLLELELVGVPLAAGRDAELAVQRRGVAPASRAARWPSRGARRRGRRRPCRPRPSPSRPGSRPYGSRIIALPVRISSSSTPTPLLKMRKRPLSWARLGSQRISQARPLSPRSSRSIASGFVAALVPEAAVDDPHEVRVRGPAAAGLVRGEQDLGPAQRGDAHVLDDVVVVADEEPGAEAVRRVEDRVLVARPGSPGARRRGACGGGRGARRAWPRRRCCGRRRPPRPRGARPDRDPVRRGEVEEPRAARAVRARARRAPRAAAP